MKISARMAFNGIILISTLCMIEGCRSRSNTSSAVSQMGAQDQDIGFRSGELIYFKDGDGVQRKSQATGVFHDGHPRLMFTHGPFEQPKLGDRIRNKNNKEIGTIKMSHPKYPIMLVELDKGPDLFPNHVNGVRLADRSRPYIVALSDLKKPYHYFQIFKVEDDDIGKPNDLNRTVVLGKAREKLTIREVVSGKVRERVVKAIPIEVGIDFNENYLGSLGYIKDTSVERPEEVDVVVVIIGYGTYKGRRVWAGLSLYDDIIEEAGWTLGL